MISLKSRTFTPPEEVLLDSVLSAPEGERLHVLIQFKSIPDQSVKSGLRNAGIRLLNYIPKNAWFASVPTDLTPDNLALSSVRWIGKILPKDKISPSIREKGIGDRGRTDDGKVKLVIKYFKDVSGEELKKRLEQDGVTVLGETLIANSITISISEERISNIAGEDSVLWIGPVPSPAHREADRVRAHIQAEGAQALGLSGIGVNVGVFENAHVYTNHSDLQGRAAIGDTDTVDYGEDGHATMVAGIIGGDGNGCEFSQGGSSSWNENDWCYEGRCQYDWCKDHCGDEDQWRGIAPAAEIFSYNFSTGGTPSQNHDNYITDLITAIDTHQIDIANNSWGQAGCEEFDYGNYEGLCSTLDSVVRGDYGRPVAVVFSAGNERDGYGKKLALKLQAYIARTIRIAREPKLVTILL